MIKPYYSEPGITLYHGDCRVILPELIAGGLKADLRLCDPPYGLGNKLTGWGRKVGETAVWDRIIPELPNLIRFATNQIVWGGNYYQLPLTRCWLGWIKRDAVATCASLELAWTNYDAPSKYFDFPVSATNSQRNGHPTIKPLELMRWCLSLSHEAKTVIDPFCGSGPVPRACKDLGKQCVAIEIEERYLEIAARRLSQEVLPLCSRPVESEGVLI